MSRQLITFQLGDQILGVDIMAIREIRARRGRTVTAARETSRETAVNAGGGEAS